MASFVAPPNVLACVTPSYIHTHVYIPHTVSASQSLQFVFHQVELLESGQFTEQNNEVSGELIIAWSHSRALCY